MNLLFVNILLVVSLGYLTDISLAKDASESGIVKDRGEDLFKRDMDIPEARSLDEKALPPAFNVTVHIFFDGYFEDEFGPNETNINSKIDQVMSCVMDAFNQPSLTTQINFEEVNRTRLEQKYGTSLQNGNSFKRDFKRLIAKGPYPKSTNFYVLFSALSENESTTASATSGLICAKNPGKRAYLLKYNGLDIIDMAKRLVDLLSANMGMLYDNTWIGSTKFEGVMTVNDSSLMKPKLQWSTDNVNALTECYNDGELPCFKVPNAKLPTSSTSVPSNTAAKGSSTGIATSSGKGLVRGSSRYCRLMVGFCSEFEEVSHLCPKTCGVQG